MSPKPVFMCPPGGELHRRYANYFTRFEKDAQCDIVMHVKTSDLQALNVQAIHDKLTVLQHYPHLFRRFLTGVEFRFEHPHKKNQLLAHHELINPLVVAFFKKLLWYPAVPFFVRDAQLRFQMVGGDILLSGEYQAKEVPGKAGFDVILDHTKMNLLTERLSLGARFLQLFCYGTDVDPGPEVDEVCKGMSLILRYEMVRAELENDLAHNRSTADGKFLFN